MSISLCMFVKDEESCIVGCIESVRSIVSEVVVVDTGSTDRTIELARPLANKLVEIPFTNFGEIRTQTLRLASPEHDWVLMLDADERILPADLPAFEKLVNQTEVDVWCLPRNQWMNLEMKRENPEFDNWDRKVYPDFQARLLYRKNEGLYYGNRVHETINGYKKLGHARGPHIQHFHHVYKDIERRGRTYAFYDKLGQPFDAFYPRK